MRSSAAEPTIDGLVELHDVHVVPESRVLWQVLQLGEKRGWFTREGIVDQMAVSGT